MPQLNLLVDECAELSFEAALPLLPILLAGVGLVLIRVVESFKCGVGELTVFSATNASLAVVQLAFLGQVEELVWWASVVEWLMSEDAMVPIVILRFVSAERSFVSVNVEYYGVYGFQV